VVGVGFLVFFFFFFWVLFGVFFFFFFLVFFSCVSLGLGVWGCFCGVFFFFFGFCFFFVFSDPLFGPTLPLFLPSSFSTFFSPL